MESSRELREGATPLRGPCTALLASAVILLGCHSVHAATYATPLCPLQQGCVTFNPPPTSLIATAAYLTFYSGYPQDAQVLNPVTTITGNTVEISGTYTRLPLPPKPAPGPAGLYLELPLLPAGHYTFVVDLAPDPSYPNPPPVNTATGRVAAGVTLAAALDVTYVAAITPQAGLWWNPDESGTGYSFDVKHGVLVVTVYSYTPEGSPIWYLAFGPIVHNFAALTNFRYANGQCISCPYKPPVDNGIGGDMQIEFTSPTSANVYLTGRRTTFTIVPQDF